MKVPAAALALLICILAPFLPHAAASAEETDGRRYARADARNIYFCADMDERSALFAIPYTYCVEILADNGDWYLVRYGKDEDNYRAVTGYCKKEGLTDITALPPNIWLNFPVTVTLRSQVPADGSMPGLEIEVIAAYYGVYYNGATAYSYVLYNGAFCYVNENFEDYPLNPIQSEPAFSQTDPPSDGGAKLYTALAIAGIAVTAVAFLALSGARKNQKRQ